MYGMRVLMEEEKRKEERGKNCRPQIIPLYSGEESKKKRERGRKRHDRLMEYIVRVRMFIDCEWMVLCGLRKSAACLFDCLCPLMSKVKI